jgi:hypothetical protein
MIGGTRLDAGACSLDACFSGSGVACIRASDVGSASSDPNIIDRCDWKSTSPLCDPTLTLSFRACFERHSNLHRISEMRAQLEVGTDTVAYQETKLVEIEFAGQENV